MTNATNPTPSSVWVEEGVLPSPSGVPEIAMGLMSGSLLAKQKVPERKDDQNPEQLLRIRRLFPEATHVSLKRPRTGSNRIDG